MNQNGTCQLGEFIQEFRRMHLIRPRVWGVPVQVQTLSLVEHLTALWCKCNLCKITQPQNPAKDDIFVVQLASPVSTCSTNSRYFEMGRPRRRGCSLPFFLFGQPREGPNSSPCQVSKMATSAKYIGQPPTTSHGGRRTTRWVRCFGSIRQEEMQQCENSCKPLTG